MSLTRKVIREKVKELLAGRTTAGDQVFTNQATAAWYESLPAVLIYPRTEDIELFAVSPREYKRVLQLAIEVQAKTTKEKSAEDFLDEICHEIEYEMARDERLATKIVNEKEVALVDEMVLSGIEFDFEADGSSTIGAARMNFNVVYYETTPSPEQVQGLGDFQKVFADWKIGHHDSAPDVVVDAQDEVDIPT